MGKRIALIVMLFFIFSSNFFPAIVVSPSNSPQIKKFFEFPVNDTLKKYCMSFLIARYGCTGAYQQIRGCPPEIYARLHTHINAIKRFVFAQVGTCVQEVQEDKLNTIILDAVQQKRKDVLKVIIEYFYVNEKQPAICLLASKGYSESCRHLLENGEEVDRINLLMKTPLICAAQNGYDDTVKLLLQKNANTDLQTACKKDAIVLAQEKGYASIALLIMQEKVAREKRKLNSINS